MTDIVVGLPQYLHQSLHKLLVGSSASCDSNSNDEDWWAGTDLDGIDDPESLHRFMGAYDYLFDCSNDDDLDPAHECFMTRVMLEDVLEDDEEGWGDTMPAPMIPPCAPAPPGGGVQLPPVAPLCPELEQLREIEKRLEKERQRVAQLATTLEQECTNHGDGSAARRRACDVQHRINEDVGGE